MPFINDGVAVREVSPNLWRLTEPLIYEGTYQEFVVPESFVTDFASVPKLLTWLVPPYGLYTKAAVLHDYLLQSRMVSRSDADGIFRRAMRELGVSFLRRWMMWAAVRSQGKLADSKPGEVLLVILIAIPSLLFLFIPVVVVLIWLLMFFVLECIVFAGIKMTSKKTVSPPSLLLGADATDKKMSK
jgi:hypothetical protein